VFAVAFIPLSVVIMSFLQNVRTFTIFTDYGIHFSSGFLDLRGVEHSVLNLLLVMCLLVTNAILIGRHLAQKHPAQSP
jgi:hypothetical protein